MTHPTLAHAPLRIYASKHPNEQVRMHSSSGGVFTAISEQVIQQGGVVFGARFDANWEVVHAYAENMEEVEKFRGSKYVQSRIGNAFVEVEHFLQQGRNVLFSGTPCQVAGLKRYLGKSYSNLLTVDLACFGVPSPGLWRKYLAEKCAGEQILSLSFRDKVTGWKSSSCTLSTPQRVISMRVGQSPWMRAFMKNLTVRPSCFHCPFKCMHSSADVTIGDLWGVQKLCPEIDDDKGVSFVVEHTAYQPPVTALRILTLEEVTRCNPFLIDSNKEPVQRAKFLRKTRVAVLPTFQQCTRNPFILKRVWNKLHQLIKR
jgi:hypothetical protein